MGRCLWRFAAGTPGCSYLRYLPLEQKGTEPDLASTDLCEKGTFMFVEVPVLLQGIICVADYWLLGSITCVLLIDQCKVL